MANIREIEVVNPRVRQAQLFLRDARLALERPMTNTAQITDVLRSVNHFMDFARAALASIDPTKEPRREHPTNQPK